MYKKMLTTDSYSRMSTVWGPYPKKTSYKDQLNIFPLSCSSAYSNSASQSTVYYKPFSIHTCETYALSFLGLLLECIHPSIWPTRSQIFYTWVCHLFIPAIFGRPNPKSCSWWNIKRRAFQGNFLIRELCYKAILQLL